MLTSAKQERSVEERLICSLNTPAKVQRFLDGIPFNNEEHGETCMSAHRVAREGRAHCLEAGFFAGACFLAAGREPIIVSLKVKQPDDDHILVLFRENGYFGAISKTSHPVLRYRDPVYRSVRELVMSYFHEYFLFKNGTKTMRGYTRPINLTRFGATWIDAEEDLWGIASTIYHTPIREVVPKENRHLIRPATTFERTALDVLEWG